MILKEGENMRLDAGKRIRVPDDNTYVQVVSGKVEVYAVTRKKISFRQIFLMELGMGGAVFPPMDEFEQIDILIYALEDTELMACPLAEAEPLALREQMRAWFSALVELPWVRLMADRGDEILKYWKNGGVPLGDGSSLDVLLKQFEKNESIFVMLAGIRFNAQDKRLAQRIEAHAGEKSRIIAKSVAELLGEEHLPIGEVPNLEKSFNGTSLEDMAFIVDCAAQALKMPPRDIRVSPEKAKNLSQFSMLQRLVRRCGMQMRLVRLEGGWHTGDSGVLLGFWGNRKELAALLPVTPESYRMVTNKHPDGVPVTEDIAKEIGSDAFVIYAGLPGRKITSRELLTFILRQCWNTDWKTLLFVSIVMGLIPLITPVVTETIFKDIIPILDRKGLATVTQVVMVSGFTVAALGAVRSIAFLRMETKAGLAVAAAMVNRLLSFPARFFRDFQSGDIANRMSGLEQITSLLSGELVGTVFSFVFSFWSLLLMLYYSVKLTAVAIFLWILYIIISLVIIKCLVQTNREMTKAKNKTSGILQQIFAGLVKFRAKGAEEYAYHLWSEKFAAEWKHSYRIGWLNGYNSVISAVQPILLSLAVYYFGMKELADSMSAAAQPGSEAMKAAFGMAEPMSVATFIAFQAAYTAFNSSINTVVSTIAEFSLIKPLLENLQPFLEAQPEDVDEKNEADALSGALEVRNLTFSYGEDMPEVLRDVSFRVAAGEHVAIVGKSGCGKSTLIRLLLGFETPKSGAVYYDGQDLSDLSLPSVRSQMGVVLQNGQLMTGDIYRNIIGTSDLTLDDAWKAAEAAGVADDIREMPMQMQTMISEGSTNISGGQRQRILIARALAMKPSIVICDEATSALDNRTQAIVTESLDRLKATRIVVAHRLSTIRHADRIIVLDGGRIAESGTYGELVKRGGIFASFVKRQVT